MVAGVGADGLEIKPPVEFLGRPLSKTARGHIFGVAADYVKQLWTVRGYEEPHSDEGCLAAAATIQGVRMLLARCVNMSDEGYEAFEGDFLYIYIYIYLFLQAWTMEPGQRILKVHRRSQQIADCLTKIMTPQAAHREASGW